MINFAYVYLMGDTAEQKLVEDAMRKDLWNLIKEGGDFLARLQKYSPEDNVRPEWMQDQDHPDELTGKLEDATPDTLTFSGNLYGEAIDRNLLNNIVHVGTILEKVTNGVPCQVKVDSFTSSSSVIANVSAYGNTTPVFDTVPTTWTVVSTPGYDSKAFGDALFVERDVLETYTQIFQEYLSIERTRKNLGMKIIADELDWQRQKAMRKIRRDLAKAMLRSRPSWSGSAWQSQFETQASSLAGLYWWFWKVQNTSANTGIYRDIGGASLTYQHLKDLAASMRDSEGCNFKRGDMGWEIWTSPTQKRIINSFDQAYRRTTGDTKTAGFEIVDLLLEEVEIRVHTDMLWRTDAVCILPMKKMGYGDFKGDSLKLEKHPSVPRLDLREINFQVYGLLPLPPRQMGIIYNAQTS